MTKVVNYRKSQKDKTEFKTLSPRPTTDLCLKFGTAAGMILEKRSWWESLPQPSVVITKTQGKN